MDYKVEVFAEQFPIVKAFVYHLIYYRELREAYTRLQLDSPFWEDTINAHLLQATIQWCKVFGSDGCNPTHWKNLSNQQSGKLQQSFRDGISQHTGLTQAEWEKCWKDMLDFRNKHAAHREFGYRGPVPKFDTALNIAYYYDDWIREVIYPDYFEEPLLKKSANGLRQSVAPLINHLLQQTNKYQGQAKPGETDNSGKA